MSVASVQDLIAAANAKAPKSALSGLADLVNAASGGYDQGTQIANIKSETELRRAEVAKKLVEIQQAQAEAAAQEQLRKQLEEKLAVQAEQDIRAKQAATANGKLPPTPVGKFTEKWSQDEKGKVSRTIELVSPKPADIPSGYRQTADGNLEFVPGGPADPAIKDQANTEKDQNKLYHQSVMNLRNFFSSRAGNFGTQDAKVNQAVHLRGLADQYYNPANGGYDIPEAQSNEMIMGLANMVSNSNVTTMEGLRSVTPKNFQSDTAHIVSYWTGKPITNQPQEMTKNILDSIDRQGKIAEDLRNTYLQQGKDVFVEPGLNEANTKRLLGARVGSSFKDYLATSPSRSQSDKIAVVRLSDNSPGTIDAKDFDPKKYKRQ